MEQLETILNLTRDLGVNLAGIEIILNMRRRMRQMQEEMQAFVDYVQKEFLASVREGPRGNPKRPGAHSPAADDPLPQGREVGVRRQVPDVKHFALGGKYASFSTIVCVFKLIGCQIVGQKAVTSNLRNLERRDH